MSTVTVGRALDQDLPPHTLLERESSGAQPHGPIVSKSRVMRNVLAQAHLVAPTNATVLLLGETGVGKEVLAQAIHDASPRRHRPMIRVNLAAIPTTLIESELFGHERGAFTDAFSRKIGRFEAANGSTLFLDEIGELPPEMQVKLLRVLEARTIERLGGRESIEVDIRILAATNRNLETAVRNKGFREDLFYRLNVFPITIPPLRERVEDIPDLAWIFIDELSRRFGKTFEAIAPEGLSDLLKYSWPGNVRELRNVIERAMIVARSSTLTPVVPRPRVVPLSGSLRLVDIETEHIRSVLESCGWRVRGQRGAALQLGIKPTTLESRMARLGIRRDRAHPQ
jgi:transcriptional regulator with GAF, ATPase, and Fis domain